MKRNDNDNEDYRFQEYNFAYTILLRNKFVFSSVLNCRNMCCCLL